VTNANPANLDALIAAHQAPLRAFIRKRIRNRADTEDVLQDVFYQLAKTVNAAMQPIEHVAAWLYRVARNAVINHGTKKREEALPADRHDESGDEALRDFSDVLCGDETSPSPSPETEYLRALVWTELERALAELPPEQREVFELTEMEGLPLKEIARTTGVAVNTLLSRKHYAVVHLRRRLRALYRELIYA
jgi:RNA polymerase sigma factor (sigma-70 family)